MSRTSSSDQERLWRDVFTNPGHPVYQLTRLEAHVFKRFGSDPRCRICKVPLAESPGWIARVTHKGPSTWNPNFCSSCETWVSDHPGGAEIPLSVLFADVRGSTRMAERHGPTHFANLMERFYQVGADVLHSHDAMVDKPAGDEVRGFFLPVMSRRHARSAVLAGLAIIEATRDGDGVSTWLPVGVGVHTGTAYVGTVEGGGGRVQNITALGDVVNVAARLSSLAQAGEVLASADAYRAARVDLADVTFATIPVRGRQTRLEVVSIHSAS